MSSKSKIPPPIQFVKDLLTDSPKTREQLKDKMVKEDYSTGTINSQLFQLRHWKGAKVTEDGFTRNPDYVEEVKERKAKKEKKTKVSKKAKAPRMKKARPVPKSSIEKAADAA